MNLKYYLLILQLEAYRALRFIRWVFRAVKEGANSKLLKPEKNKEPVWTAKAKQLYWLAIGIFIGISLWLLLSLNIFIALAIIIVLWLNIYVCLILALAVIKPYEIVNRLRVKTLIKNKIKYLKTKHQLTVIGITGSFGKTSSKMVIGQVTTKMPYNA